MNKIFNIFLNLILPQKCLRCGKSGEILCENCLPRLRRCEDFLGEDVFAVFSYYDPTISEAIKLLKYRGIRMVVPSLAKFMREVVFEEISEAKTMAGFTEDEKIIVVPVPLHKDRLIKRGFNQSEIIARSIINSLNEDKLVLETGALIRTKHTESQVKAVSRTKRLINLNNAFKVVTPEKIKGKVILLIDDVITTGATISECKKELMKAGACKVIVLAVAH
ncbi:MAG: Phosphoribosyltransferase [Candidatus Nomurabacteria bacterium GW2011_GWF2_35_66]|nr:MAG: Phosphoribosyltransferase [Candidatus Nomurabacteria bacterium GW2011_GWF2_35_66]HBM45428.1 hypothetical protein [Patescibacteria group bacterium]